MKLDIPEIYTRKFDKLNCLVISKQFTELNGFKQLYVECILTTFNKKNYLFNFPIYRITTYNMENFTTINDLKKLSKKKPENEFIDRQLIKYDWR